MDLDVHNPAERDAALASIDAALARAGAEPVRRVGAPYVQSWLERQSGAASVRYFPFSKSSLASRASGTRSSGTPGLKPFSRPGAGGVEAEALSLG